MFLQFTQCPNAQCQYHHGSHRAFYIKKGYYQTRHNHQWVPRYRCRGCGKTFSTHTGRLQAGQKKPQLNGIVFKLYASGTTQRRLARVLQCNRKTIVRKFRYMARLARIEHERRIATGELLTTYVQIDEQETYEHTRHRPLSIALAVRVKTGEIISAKAATFRTRPAHWAPAKYLAEDRQDNRHEAMIECLETIKRCVRPGETLTIESDKTRHYLKSVREVLPSAQYQRVEKKLPSHFTREEQKKMRKPLFMVNHVCAKLRNDLSRMGRKTWVTTKKIEALQDHLDLYVAWNNGYRLAG